MKKDFFYTLHYTNTNTPPPFLYELMVHFTIHEDKVDIKYEKHFLDREQFSEEELEDEGFSMNDDSLVDASLNKVWVDYFTQLLSLKTWCSLSELKDVANNNYIRLSKQGAEDQYLVLDGIEYQLEEVLQAQLETLEIESPLSIVLRKNLSKTNIDSELYWGFKDRIFEVKNKKNSTFYTWEEGREILTIFYNTDLSEQQVFKNKIPEGCTCINPGDGLWYKTPSNPIWKELLVKLLPH